MGDGVNSSSCRCTVGTVRTSFCYCKIRVLVLRFTTYCTMTTCLLMSVHMGHISKYRYSIEIPTPTYYVIGDLEHVMT